MEKGLKKMEKTVNVKLCELKDATIDIGFVGENLYRRLRIDCADAYAEYTHAAASMTVQPPEAEAYPAVLERDGDSVVWTLTDSDLANDGEGEIQLAFTADEVVRRTWIGRIRIHRSIMPTGNAPSGIDDFLTRAGAALTAIPETIDAALEEAKESGEFDGYSPTVTVTDIEGGHRVSITDVNGTTTVDVMNGTDGEDGYSPTVTVTDIEGGHRVSITDVNGTTTVDVMNGTDGEDGYSPTVTVTDIEGGHRVSITDATGTTTFDVMNGATGATPNITIGTVTTGAAGSDAAATMTGTPEDPVLNLTIPRGDPGEVSEEELQEVAEAKADVIQDAITTPAAIMTIPDGGNGFPLKMQFRLDPVQDLHGQSNPYPPGGGKNMFGAKLSDCKTINTNGTWSNNAYTINGVTFTVYEHDGYIDHIATSGTASSTVALVLGGIELTSGVQYTVSGCPSGGSNTKYSLMLTAEPRQGAIGQKEEFGSGANYTENTTTERGIQAVIRNGQNSTGLVFYPMIRLESVTDGSFAPYSNICHITGHTGFTRIRTGVNVWDEEWELGAILNGDPVSSPTSIRSANFSACRPNTSYYVKSNIGLRLHWYDSTKAWIEMSASIGNGVITTPHNAYFFKIAFPTAYGTTYNNDISINYPSTDTDYHAYTGVTKQSTFHTPPGTVYGGTITDNGDGTGTLTVDRVAVDPTMWTQYNSSNGYKAYRMQNLPLARYNNDMSNMPMSNMISEFGAFSSSSMNRNIIQPPRNSTNIAYLALKEDLNASDVQLCYLVGYPVTYNITMDEMKSLKGINNVWIDEGTMQALEYCADTKLYVNKKIKASQNLMELIVTANHEDEMKATKAYSSGDLMIVNATLYKATTSIANGATLTVGTNVSATTVAAEIAALS